MTCVTRAVVPLLSSALLATASAALPQAPAGSTARSASQARVDTLGAARSAVAAGDTRRAVELLNALLAREPGNREAAALKIQALSEATDVDGAVEAYEAWARAAGADDLLLLAPAAAGAMRELANYGGGTQVLALEQIARSGDAAARSELQRLSSSRQPGNIMWPEALVALARLGDRRALDEVVEWRTGVNPSHRAAALKVLGSLSSSPPGTEATVRDGLDAAEWRVRVAAADAARTRRLEDLAPTLTTALSNDRHPLVRVAAAGALATFGDRDGEIALQSALASEVADVRLAAAEIYAARGDRRWTAMVRPLLEGPDPLARVRAAALLADSNASGEAMAALRDAVQEQNPAVKAEAVRALMRTPSPDGVVLAKLLRDPIPAVRVAAATRLLDAGSREAR